MGRSTPPFAASKTLLQPLRLSVLLATIVLILSLGFLAYTAWRSANSLHPLEETGHQIYMLQQADLAITKILASTFDHDISPDDPAIAKVRDTLNEVLQDGGNLDPTTPKKIALAQQYLTAPMAQPRIDLVQALSLTRQVVALESGLQHAAIKDARNSAQTEFTVAASALVITPFAFIILMFWINKRSFQSIKRLSALLNNVGTSQFTEVKSPPQNDPFALFYTHYNEMVRRLNDLAAEAQNHTDNLEGQIRTASETLLRQQAELENGAKLAAIGEFSARLAHELRNPISGISAALHNMEVELSDPEQQERVTLITEELDRVTRLLNSLLAHAPHDHEVPVETSTQRLFGDILRLFAYRLPDSITLTSEIHDATVSLPRDTTRQILLNLLKNSAEAIADQNATISVTVATADDTVTLIVTDTGPGYPDALLESGIRPFRTYKPSGTGLGLSVVQRMVEAIGGEIYIDRAQQGGALTKVIIPAHTPANK